MKKHAPYFPLCLLACLIYFFGSERAWGGYAGLSQEPSLEESSFSAHEIPVVENGWNFPFFAIQEHTVLNSFQETSRLMQKLIRLAHLFTKTVMSEHQTCFNFPIASGLSGHDTGYYIFVLRKIRI